MRWEFIGRENAPLGEALRALAEARGWGGDEAESLLAGFGPFPAQSGTPATADKRGDSPAVIRDPAPLSAGLLDAFRGHSSYRAARGRIKAAAMGQRIVLFGDYDADGITAVAQVHRFLAVAGYRDRDLSWFVPDRMRHGYGLTKAAAEECLATCREEWARSPVKSQGGSPRQQAAPQRARAAGPSEPPILLIALDCGSASGDVIAELGTQGVDCIVVDHHQPPDLAGAAHPAVAHLNPHAWEGDDPDLVALRMLSASGLAWYLCAALAQDLQVERWDRAAGLVLAGLGTVADVVPLTGPNRLLVKAALMHANETDFLERRLPGLAKLHELSGGGAVDARTFGYRWGPRLNASGRIEDARQPVELLLAGDPNRISELARACERANEDRKVRTARVLDEALQVAAKREGSGARDRVLVLWDESWEPGIVGIVASRLREQMRVPTIILGKHPGQQVWKGSGRSAGDYDLGAEVRRAVEAGFVRQGGGHHHAAGLTVACRAPGAAAPAGGAGPAEAAVPAGVAGTAVPVEELESLRAWLNDRCSLDARDLEPVYEVLAPVHAVEALHRAAKNPRDPSALVKFWCDLYNRFEPFGVGNPRPGLLLQNAELIACHAKTTMKGVKTTGSAEASSTPPVPRVWAISARFRWNGAESLLVDWTDPDAANMVWSDPKEYVHGVSPPVRYDLVLEPHCSSTAAKPGGASRTWYDWRVVACARREPETSVPAPGTARRQPRSG